MFGILLGVTVAIAGIVFGILNYNSYTRLIKFYLRNLIRTDRAYILTLRTVRKATTTSLIGGGIAVAIVISLIGCGLL